MALGLCLRGHRYWCEKAPPPTAKRNEPHESRSIGAHEQGKIGTGRRTQAHAGEVTKRIRHITAELPNAARVALTCEIHVVRCTADVSFPSNPCSHLSMSLQGSSRGCSTRAVHACTRTKSPYCTDSYSEHGGCCYNSTAPWPRCIIKCFEADQNAACVAQ
jgi:hypothetical protein